MVIVVDVMKSDRMSEAAKFSTSFSSPVSHCLINRKLSTEAN